jgi:hypothetical protein
MTNEKPTETEGKAARWRNVPPKKAGWYEMRCDENGFTPEKMGVADRAGKLWVQCPDHGWVPLTYYHNSLTQTQWRKAPNDERSGPPKETKPTTAGAPWKCWTNNCRSRLDHGLYITHACTDTATRTLCGVRFQEFSDEITPDNGIGCLKCRRIMSKANASAQAPTL